jgi:hypothetical protein
MNPLTTAHLTEAQRELSRQRTSQQDSAQADMMPEDRVQREHAREVQRKATMLATVGLNRGEIEAQLLKEGVDPGLAAKYATKSTAMQDFVPEGKTIATGTGHSQLIKGALLVIGGIVASVISYSSAAPGGTYTLWVGAVLGGGILIIRGLFSD